jgi:hypothetical protein
MKYEERLEELQELAFLDSSADYEVDYCGIYSDGSLFYYITASGCSCWSGDEGEWDEESFNDFESLRRFVLDEDMERYNPSLNGAKALIEEAERKLGY